MKTGFQGPRWGELRRNMLQGEPVSGCLRCYEEEAAGKKSLRMRYNAHPKLGLHHIDLARPQVFWLEIAFSNRCNAACRMCDSRYSTRWARDEDNPQPLYQLNLEELTPFFPSLKHVKITGGEPFFDRNHKVFLKRLCEEADPGRIYLNYSTNLTLFPDEEVLKLWEKFERVEVALSLDSIFPEETYYIRYPSDGETVMKNSLAFIGLLDRIPQLVLILRSTVGIFNIHSIPETLSWWLEQRQKRPDLEKRMLSNPTHLTLPRYLRASCLKPEQKQSIVEKFQRFRKKEIPALTQTLDYLENYLHNTEDEGLYEEFLAQTRRLDERRGQNCLEVFPHLR